MFILATDYNRDVLARDILSAIHTHSSTRTSYRRVSSGFVQFCLPVPFFLARSWFEARWMRRHVKKNVALDAHTREARNRLARPPAPSTRAKSENLPLTLPPRPTLTTDNRFFRKLNVLENSFLLWLGKDVTCRAFVELESSFPFARHVSVCQRNSGTSRVFHCNGVYFAAAENVAPHDMK
ncbi:hypothetical protein PUN28_013547 [Cardiocondyla obscurior]|uniref:Uncharacterized protein n=1 Tax=Cardiocondyla obscurior TaxID=286306 RepID=A0AAW2F5I6_9HYME